VCQSVCLCLSVLSVQKTEENLSSGIIDQLSKNNMLWRCVELDVARDTSSEAPVSRAGFDTLASSSSFFGTDQRHVTSVTSCRPASLATPVSNATPFAPPPSYDKNMNIQPIRAHCKHCGQFSVSSLAAVADFILILNELCFVLLQQQHQ